MKNQKPKNEYNGDLEKQVRKKGEQVHNFSKSKFAKLYSKFTTFFVNLLP